MQRTAVIGVGHLGQQHARIQAALAAEGMSEFKSVCDINAELVKRVAAEWQTNSAIDWRALIGNVDAVSLAVPTESHCEIACGLLESGIHVLVEKPISRTLEEADLMIAAGRAADFIVINSRKRVLASLRAGDANEASVKMEEHLRLLGFIWRLAQGR